MISLENKVILLSDKELGQIGLPSATRNQVSTLSREVLRSTSYNIETLSKYVEDNEPQLVPDQATAYQVVFEKITSKAGEIVFLDAPGGTGKTFVPDLLLAKVRQQQKIALVIASPSITFSNFT